MAAFAGLNLSGTSNAEIADALIALNRSLEYQMGGHIDSQNIFEVGGWNVGPDSLSAKSLDVGMSAADVGIDPVRFWAGSTNIDNAPFRVHHSGKFVATDAEITGTIHMTGGEIVWDSDNLPNYSDLPGPKPPVDADNTNANLPASLGINFTRIGQNYIYTGTLNANQINVGTLTGISIQTAPGSQRVIMDPNGFRSLDQYGTKRISIESGSSVGYAEIGFWGQSGRRAGSVFGDEYGMAMVGTNQLLLGGYGGIVIDGSTPFIDFQYREIRNFQGAGVALFG